MLLGPGGAVNDRSAGVRIVNEMSVAMPAPDTCWLRRETLLRRLDDAGRHRLTLLTAGAGFGKTSLLSDWTQDRSHAWVTATGTGTSLFRDVIVALRPAVPLAVDGPPPGLPVGDPSVQLSRVDDVVGAGCEQLTRQLDGDLALVIDDVHEIEDDPVAVRVVASLARQAPAGLHLMLASRSPPPFAIERMRGQGQVLTLTADDLAFSGSEVASMLEALLPDAPTRLAEPLHELTGGWPALIRIVVEALRPLAPAAWDGALTTLADTRGPLFGYLAREVIEQQPPPVRALLQVGTVLDRFTAPLAEHLGVCDAEEALRALERAGGQVEEPEPGRFALRSLVRQVCAHSWPVPPDEATRIRGRATAWLESCGEIEWALRVSATGRDHDRLAALLTAHGNQLLSAGSPDVVARLVEAVPDAARTPALNQLAGEAYSVLGEHDDALRFLDASLGDRPLSPALAWRMMQAHYFRDDLERGMQVFDRCERATGPSFDRAMLLSWAASITARLGDTERTRSLVDTALRAAAESGDDRAQAAAHTAAALVVGKDVDPDARGDHLRTALTRARRAGDFLQAVRIRNAQGSTLLERGDYEAAIVELGAAASEAARAGFAGQRALALMNRGLAHWCRGRLDDAHADYEAAVQVYRRTASREVCYALIGLGDVHREQGNLALARAAYEEGLALAERTGDRQGIVPGLYQLAKVLVDDDPARADALVQRAVAYGWPDRAWAHNAAGWVALCRGDDESAARAATDAGTAARELRDGFGLAESLELAAACASAPENAARLLEEARTLWQLVGNQVHEAACSLALAQRSHGPASHAAADRARRTLRRLGVHARPSAAAGLLRFVASEDLAPVSVQALGDFSVSRYGQPVPREEWHSHKARDVLKILVTRRGVGTSREQVMDALWPDEPTGKLRNRLSVALSTLRKVLDPDRRFAGDHFVTVDGDRLGLDLAHVVVDVELFLHEAEVGLARWSDGRVEQAVARLTHAEGLYGGDLLEGDYEEWVSSLRDEARSAYVSVAHALAEHALARREPVLAAGFLRRVIDRNPYDEQAHLSLVRALGAAGRHGDARRAYGVYAQHVHELGIEPVAFPLARDRAV